MRLIRSIAALATVAVCLLAGSCGGSEKFPVRTYQMGEKVTLGPFIYNVFETQWLTQLGDEVTPRLPQHRFFVVRVSILNSGGTELMGPNLSVVDDSGKVYEELSNGDGVPQWIGYLRQFKPADSSTGNLVFDAPPRRYKLRVLDETGERAALIEIPLSFNAESPQVTSPANPTRK